MNYKIPFVLKSTLILIAAITISIISIALVVGSISVNYVYQGNVKDVNGNPISGVEVSFEFSDISSFNKKVVSNSCGDFTLIAHSARLKNVSASKDNYEFKIENKKFIYGDNIDIIGSLSSLD